MPALDALYGARFDSTQKAFVEASSTSPSRPLRGDHCPGRRLRAQERPLEVDLHHLIPRSLVETSNDPPMSIPALDTNTSRRPKRSTHSSTRPCTSFALRTSARSNTTSGSPPRVTLDEACSRMWRAPTTTLTPSELRRSVIAWPIPWVPPVTTAARPAGSRSTESPGRSPLKCSAGPNDNEREY